MRAMILLAIGAAALAGCATGSEKAAAPATAAERGRLVAARVCSSCHAIASTGESPRAGAPPFRDVRLRYNALSFQHRMEEIAAGGHFDMPPLTLQPGEASDLSAYIESLSTP